MGQPLRILFLASEAIPFSKTGGLGDVAGSLPPALKRLGTEPLMVLPLYGETRQNLPPLTGQPRELDVPLGPDTLRVRFLETRAREEIPVFLLEREDLFERPNLYTGPMGDYYDNLERFTVFCHGALRLCKALAFPPHIVHAHDWQTGLVPALLKGPYGAQPLFRDSRTVFTIHNLAYQGLFPPERLPLTGLPWDPFFRMEGLEYYGRISLLKSGIVFSDLLTTVSPTYAKEIQSPEYGEGMDGILRTRSKDLVGILNGIDGTLWDPSRDPHLPRNYSARDLEGKKACKEALLRELGLDPSEEPGPLLGMVARLDPQKGLDLVLAALEEILEMGILVAILGSGQEAIQRALGEAQARHPRRMALRVGFDEGLAHRIIAGADLILVPSRYEPCGLTQMYALRYGTVPVVRATGGLADTVIPFRPERGTGSGFTFSLYTPKALLGAVQDALDLYRQPSIWMRLIQEGMKTDFSWDRSARLYLDLFQLLLSRPPLPRPTS